MLHQIPFVIRGFHCDNGSEFINHQVAGLLEKLRVEFTKSRAYRTTDNALVEGKNGAIIHKHIGHGPIAAHHAEAFQKFFTAYLNPYLNFHRPCGFASIQIGSRGRRKTYLSSRRLPNALRETGLAAEMGELLEARPGRGNPTGHLPATVGHRSSSCIGNDLPFSGSCCIGIQMPTPGSSQGWNMLRQEGSIVG
jgi:hypothetical protein